MRACKKREHGVPNFNQIMDNSALHGCCEHNQPFLAGWLFDHYFIVFDPH